MNLVCCCPLELGGDPCSKWEVMLFAGGMTQYFIYIFHVSQALSRGGKRLAPLMHNQYSCCSSCSCASLALHVLKFSGRSGPLWLDSLLKKKGINHTLLSPEEKAQSSNPSFIESRNISTLKCKKCTSG